MKNLKIYYILPDMFLAITSDINKTHKLSHLDGEKRLVYDKEYRLISNICPHQGARLQEAGQMLLCPYHGWSFKFNGIPVGSGSTQGCKNTEHLTEFPVFQNGQFLFDLDSKLPELAFLDNEYLVLEEHRIDVVGTDSRIIMDVFLDVDHIPVVHNKVYDELGILSNAEVEWTYGDKWSLQAVKTKHCDYHIPEDKTHGFGAAWLAIYPGTMIEWQPGAFFITEAVRIDHQKSKVFVWKYRDLRYPDSTWEINNSIWETAWAQDKALSESIPAFTYKNLEQAKQLYRKYLGEQK